jgi:hypothetical protein
MPGGRHATLPARRRAFAATAPQRNDAMAAMNIGCLVALGLTLIPSAPAPRGLPPPRQQSPAAAATARALAKAVDTSFLLAALPRPEPDDPRVPDSLQPEPVEAELDRTLHRQIGDFVEAWLREHGAEAPVDQLRDGLTYELWWGSTTEEPPPRHGDSDVRCPLDGTVKLTVVRPEDDPGLLAVSWKTQLSFLTNSSLLVFTTGGGRVERVLEWSAELAAWPEGDSPGILPLPFGPTDVLNNLDFRLSGRDEDGRLFVAVAWSEPSAASSWGAVSWAVLAAGSGPRSPRVLVRGSGSAWQCFDESCYVLGLAGDVVTVDYTTSAGGLAICNGYTTADVQRSWRLADGSAVAVSTHGTEPFSFLSGWISAPWGEARRWSARGAGMRRWHRLLGDVACDLERGRQWVDGCEAKGSEVLELVLLGGVGGSEPEDQRETRDSLFFVFDADEDLRLVDITPEMPAGDWQDSAVCDESDVSTDESTEPLLP